MHQNQQITNHLEWKHKENILDNIDIKINILCDQILFNPSEETITITSCQLKHGNQIKPIINHNKNGVETLNDHPNVKGRHLGKHNSLRLSDGDFIECASDVICFASTIIIFVLLLTVLIFMMNKDHETPF